MSDDIDREQEATGKAKGGVARALRLSDERKREIAQMGAAARNRPVAEAICGSQDTLLRIGDAEMPCYVLEDGRRVLSQRGILSALGMARGGAMKGRGDRLANFAAGKGISPFVSTDLMAAINKPIVFRAAGALTYGYEATILPEICEAILLARRSNALQPQQAHLAVQSEILLAALSRVGIIAMVDEATGYQAFRERDALAKILEAFVAKELQAYVQTFDPAYYRELFRLRGLEFPNGTVKRPQYFGILTNDIVYKRLAPGVLAELKQVIAKNAAGRPKHRFFQMLTQNVGYPKLKEHLGAVVAIMQLSKDWDEFMHHLDRLRPRYDKAKLLPFPEYDSSQDDGRGI